MTLRVLSFDFDGSLANKTYQRSATKDIVTCNQVFLDNLKEENKQFRETIVFVGSLRQSKAHDDHVSRRNKTGSCFLAITQIARYLNTPFCTNLLADIFGDLPDGTSYRRIMNNPNTKPHATCLHDGTKLTLLYSQLHYLAVTRPNERIIFDFFDNKEEILSNLSVFFNKNTLMLPQNICLRLNKYKDNVLSLYAEINGRGEHVDTAYRQTIINMIELTPRKEASSDRNCTDHVTPDKLNRYPSTIPTTITNKWITQKSTSLLLQLDAKITADIEEPPFAPEIHLLQTLAHLKKYIPQKDIKYEYITHVMLNKLSDFHLKNKPISIEIITLIQQINLIEQANKMKETHITYDFINTIQNFKLPISKKVLLWYIGFELLSQYTPQEIISRGDVDEVQALLQCNKHSFNQVNYQGMTLLEMAISTENDAIALFLIEAGAQIPCAVAHKTHAIHIIAKQGRLDLIKPIIENAPELLNALDPDNKTALLWAATYGHSDIVEWLITQGADVNIASVSNDPDTHTDHYSPLDWANMQVVYGYSREKTISALLDAGAKSNHSAFSIYLDHIKHSASPSPIKQVIMANKCYAQAGGLFRTKVSNTDINVIASHTTAPK